MQLRTIVMLAAAVACASTAPYVAELGPRLPGWQQVLEPVHGDYELLPPSPPRDLVWYRVRRSLQPGAPNPAQQPGGGGQQQPGGGAVDVAVTRERGVGTVVDAQARGNVWRSDDGNTRVDAHGEWRRVYDGPSHGQRSHNAGVVFSHRWR